MSKEFSDYTEAELRAKIQEVGHAKKALDDLHIKFSSENARKILAYLAK